MTQTATDAEMRQQRQVIFWRLLAAAFGATDQAKNIETVTTEIVETLGMPKLILDPNLAVDTLLQRYPELKPDFDALQSIIPPEEGAEAPPAPEKDTYAPEDARRWLAYSKLLLNVFGPNTMTPTVSAQQFSQWR